MARNPLTPQVSLEANQKQGSPAVFDCDDVARLLDLQAFDYLFYIFQARVTQNGDMMRYRYVHAVEEHPCSRDMFAEHLKTRSENGNTSQLLETHFGESNLVCRALGLQRHIETTQHCHERRLSVQQVSPSDAKSQQA